MPAVTARIDAVLSLACVNPSSHPKSREAPVLIPLLDKPDVPIHLSGDKPDDMRAVLRDIDRITCHTAIEGRGTRSRHKLNKLRIRFVIGDQRDLNPHRPG